MYRTPTHTVKEVGNIETLGEIVDWSLISHANIPDLWKHTMGEGIKIVVIDTGSGHKHPDITDNDLIELGSSTIPQEKSAHDENGHGTAVTGMICAKQNSMGVVGVAPKSKVISIKALSKRGFSSPLSVQHALEKAIKLKPDIVNMSLGGEREFSKRACELLLQLDKMNIPVVCASGNSGKKFDVAYPARYKTTIAVASYNRDMKISPFSSIGPQVDFIGPGEDVLLPYSNGKYAVLDGTSFAAPYVTGLIALILSIHLKKTGKKRVLTVAQIKQMLRDNILNETVITEQKFGLIDMKQAVITMNDASILPASKSMSRLNKLRMWVANVFGYTIKL
jgi:subtilisin family serine protease